MKIITLSNMEEKPEDGKGGVQNTKKKNYICQTLVRKHPPTRKFDKIHPNLFKLLTT